MKGDKNFTISKTNSPKLNHVDRLLVHKKKKKAARDDSRKKESSG